MSTNANTRPQATSERPKHSRRALNDVSTRETSSLAASPAAASDPASVGSTDTSNPARSVSVWTMLLFIVGCAILVIAAWNLPNLARWGDDYGTVLVFLAFFMVMSIGGRWFWAGIDAIWNAVRSKDNS